MAKNGWFRFYSETVSDRKLQKVARETGMILPCVIGIWSTVLSLANDSPKRGSLMMTETVALSTDDIASMLSMDIEALQDVFDLFVKLQMLDKIESVYHVTNWDKRQYVDTTNDRVKRWREKHTETSQETPDDDKCNVTETLQKRNGNVSCNAPDTDNRQQTTDKKIAATPPAPKPQSSKSEVTQFVEAFEKTQGYPIANWGLEARNAKTMIGLGYSASDAVGCRAYMKTQPFWAEKPVTLANVLKEIGEWIKQGRPPVARLPSNAHAYQQQPQLPRRVLRGPNDD